MGPRAVLIEDLDADPADWAAGAAQHVVGRASTEVVPAAETVLVVCADAARLAQVRERLATVRAARSVARRASAAPIEVPVRYDGEDLDAVASSTGLDGRRGGRAPQREPSTSSPSAGSRPGSATSADSTRDCTSRAGPTPRTRVPAGSVAIAAEYTAVYPRPSPGGWHLLGTTDRVMFDPDRSPPALLEPGAHVRFVAS